MAEESDAEARVDELFSLPPAEFVAARDLLVKELKASGDADMAVMVKKLSRPTAAASAVNHLARSHPDEIAQLLEIGRRLWGAHSAIHTDEGRSAIRSVTAERRALVTSLVTRAMSFLGTTADALREAIAHTLEAAAADPEAGEKVRAGRLSKELAAPSGLGLDLGAFGAATEGTQLDGLRPDEDRPDCDEVKARERRAYLLAVRAQVQDAERRASRSAQTAAEALREVARLEVQLDRARARASQAEEAARRAESELASAQQELQSVEATHEAGLEPG